MNPPPPPLTTTELRSRIIAYAAAACRSRLISERRLAQLANCSQPHIHNVLHGVRNAAPELVDHIARVLRVCILDLYTVHELRAIVEESQAEQLARFDGLEDGDTPLM